MARLFWLMMIDLAIRADSICTLREARMRDLITGLKMKVGLNLS